ncbi:MAG TPA: prefoldin subunit alpha [Candidatus Bilamarchaeaceae archaeon]|nr:prefoldin subunit alpha [Candidatus Bilamarchaeaceae archaeon]
MSTEKLGASSLAYERRVYGEQLRLIQKEVDRISLTNLDLINAENTTKKLKAEDSLIPIGGGAYIKANVYNTKVLVPVGAGYLIEMEAETAARELRRRIEETRKAVEKLTEEFKNISRRLETTSRKLSEMQTQDRINQRVEENLGEDYL